MAKEVRLPQLGQTMEEGTVVNCLVKENDQVQKGDVIFEIETDKATLEMESPVEGFVKKVLVSIDQTIPVGEPLLILGEENEEVAQSFIDSLISNTTIKKQVQPEQIVEMSAIPIEIKIEASPAKIIASPRAKKLAADLGVDLENIKGSGPAGKITEQDIKNAAEVEKDTVPQVAIPLDQVKLGQRIPVSSLQKITVQKMLKSKREIPCFYITVKTDVTGLTELRDRLNKTGDVTYSYNDFIIKAITTGLEKYPVMTGQIEGDMIKVQDSINIALSVYVPGGLVAPVIKDVNSKSIEQISSESKALIEKAQNNKLAPDDLEGACITISNLGAFEVDNFIPIVVPGQCSILGVGKINDICVPDNGAMVIRKQMNMSLSVDHKVVNGAYAAQFMDFVHKLLEDSSNFEVE